jgi:uncharacterized protein YacL
MKKIVLTIITAILGLVISIKIGALNALCMFILVGTVPGTRLVIPANVMLLMISTVMCVVLFYPTARNILHIILNHRSEQVKETSRSPLPKRRFSEI